MPMSAFFAGASSSISAVTAGATEVKLNGVECMVFRLERSLDGCLVGGGAGRGEGGGRLGTQGPGGARFVGG